jgi:hypothetical protein
MSDSHPRQPQQIVTTTTKSHLSSPKWGQLCPHTSPTSPRKTPAAVSSTSFGEQRLLIQSSGVADRFRRSIEVEVGHLNKKQARGKGRWIIESTEDKDDVIKRYRRIESLFRHLQVSSRSLITRTCLTDR